MTRNHDDEAAPARWLSFALLAVTGWTDAVGFLLFAGLYVSFMSGDATQLGVTAGQAQWPGVAKFLAAQLVFIAGAAVGRAVSARTGNRHRPVLLVGLAVLLALAAVVGFGIPGFVATVLAMGMLNEVMNKAAGVPVGTMVTGTLVRLGENIADRLAGRPAPIGENFGQWLAFLVAALLGTLAYKPLGAGALAVPALGCAILAALVARNPGLRTSPRLPRPTPSKGDHQ